jgi:hypothetical protein
MVSSEPNQAIVEAETIWVTALKEYPTTQRLELVKRDEQWHITPLPVDVTVPPDQFFRRGVVAWGVQERRRDTNEITAFGDVQDRPELQVLSSRLVEVNGRYSVVGELINTDADPADVTVTAILYDAQGNILTSYNAQTVMVHKLFPKEVTPFRVDFEGVAGAVLSDTVTAGDFRPEAYSPVNFQSPVASFQVYAKAVVTGRDLYRDVSVQDLHVGANAQGESNVAGRLLNVGTLEAVIPHVLVTYYDAQNRVVWVDQTFIENAIRPQRTQPFSIRIPAPRDVRTVLDTGEMFPHALDAAVTPEARWGERVALPPESGYAAMRVNVNYMLGASE